MPRQLRIEYPGAIYQVMNRGDRREPIFHDDFDRKRFVATLSEVSHKYNLFQLSGSAAAVGGRENLC